METYTEASVPLSIEHVDTLPSERLTKENIDYLEVSYSNLSSSQDSYMRDINQGNLCCSWNPFSVPKSDTQQNLPCSTSMPVPTCSYSPRNSNQFPVQTSISPTSSFTQLDILSHFHPLDSEEPKCAVCLESCSQAHHCPGCRNAVHTLCGIQVAGCEGYGAPVWCRSCYLSEREDAIHHSRTAAKRGQDKQILRMEKQSVKKARHLAMGDNIIIPIPVVDKRSPFDPPNLAGVIIESSGDGYYKIGTAAGTLDRRYLSTEVELSHSKFLQPGDVPEVTISLRQAVLSSSLGKNRLYCSCTSGCNTNRCKCRRAKNSCNSKCHRKLACHNK